VIVTAAGALRIEDDDLAPEIIDTGHLVLLPRGPVHKRLVATDLGATVIVCRFWFDPDSLRAMIFALPQVIHISSSEGAEWIDGIFRFLMIEAGDVQPGGALMISRLIALVVIRGLITYFLLRTGVLTDISTTVLLLLGIAGIGSTVAKGADNSRTTITPENRAWLLRKPWLPSTLDPNNIDAHWRDLFTTDGEFDVYRYQSFIFSIVVGGALIIGGVTQLSSFEIPQTLLGILGLSQGVYIGGKLVAPTSIADLNKSIDDLRQAEKKFRASAITANSGILPASLTAAVVPASQAAYDDYMSLATDVATLFTVQTGIAVQPAKLPPSWSEYREPMTGFVGQRITAGLDRA